MSLTFGAALAAAQDVDEDEEVEARKRAAAFLAFFH